MTSTRRLVLFGVLLGVCAVGAAVAVVLGVRDAQPAEHATAGAHAVLPAAEAEHKPVVVFGALRSGGVKSGGQVAVAGLDAPAGKRTLASLQCDRVYFAAGTGLCLAPGSGFAAGYQAKIFGPDFKVRHTVGVTGLPSRARVSPDGRYGSVTLFVTGHSYAAAGSFSTQTTLIDLRRGEAIANLEKFTVTKGGRQVTAQDVNFWGVTFARDSDRFYATMATGGKTYLIEGSVGARTARVLHENVECPSLSPDGTRIAFKHRGGSNKRPWRLTVLDLKTMRETPLSELRSVDDQAEWLDDEHVLYGIDGAIWEVRADGRGQPRRFTPAAGSPAVVRAT